MTFRKIAHLFDRGRACRNMFDVQEKPSELQSNFRKTFRLSMLLGETSFTLVDQQRFAKLSGDRNPMHLDPLAARRTQAGAPVVHGIHGALWALDRLAAAGQPIPPALQVRFEAFLYLEMDAQAMLRQQDGRVTVVVESKGRRVTTISLLSSPPEGQVLTVEGCVEPVPDRPLELDYFDASQASGAMALQASSADFEEAFPDLVRAIGVARVRAIAGLSTLVGMRLPGLHSIFSKCSIGLHDFDSETTDSLRFAVQRARPPLRQLTIGYAGSGISGTVDAFVRHPPVAQPSIDELEGSAATLELTGQRALIVGGSRGLGELTAKIAALAGAEVTVTHASGEQEAADLCRQLTDRGLSCRKRWLDVTRLEEVDLTAGEFTHLYYFATPAIFSRTTDRYDAARFHEFAQFYCDAFEKMCRRLSGAAGLKVFWPSTTAIDDVPRHMAEYIMAKLAGEALCRELERSQAGLRILTKRLPRLLTDQTSSVTPIAAEDATPLVLQILGELQ